MNPILTHKQALIIFWVCVGGMISSWVIVFVFPFIIQTSPLAVSILSWAFLPVIILIPLIGGGYFKQNWKEDSKQ